MIFIRRVVGNSMEPTLRSRQIVIAIWRRRYRLRDVVVAKASDREVIKRIISQDAGKFLLMGDNQKASSQYRVAKRDIFGGVIWPII